MAAPTAKLLWMHKRLGYIYGSRGGPAGVWSQSPIAKWVCHPPQKDENMSIEQFIDNEVKSNDVDRKSVV